MTLSNLQKICFLLCFVSINFIGCSCRLDDFYDCVSRIQNNGSSQTEAVALRWLKIIAAYRSYSAARLTRAEKKLGREDFSLASVVTKNHAERHYEVFGLPEERSLPAHPERSKREVLETTKDPVDDNMEDKEFEEIFLKHFGRMSPGNIARVIDRVFQLALQD